MSNAAPPPPLPPARDSLAAAIQALRLEYAESSARDRLEMAMLTESLNLLSQAVRNNAARMAEVERRVTVLTQFLARLGDSSAALLGVSQHLVLPSLSSSIPPTEGFSSPLATDLTPPLLGAPSSSPRAAPLRIEGAADLGESQDVAPRPVVRGQGGAKKRPNPQLSQQGRPAQPLPRNPTSPNETMISDGLTASQQSALSGTSATSLPGQSYPVALPPPPAGSSPFMPSSPSRSANPAQPPGALGAPAARAAAVARRNLHPCVRVYGHCNYGDSCKYAKYPWMSCLSFLKGRCSFGDECHELHPDMPPSNRGHGPSST